MPRSPAPVPGPWARCLYGSLCLKAGALLQIPAKLPRLEHYNEAFAWHSTEAYLALYGYRLDYPPKAAIALVRDAASGALGVAGIARQPRAWTTTA